jgi:hypothetical protein
VCLGVRRPANPFNFEQAALIQRKAPPAGHKPREPCDSRQRPALDSPQSPDSPATFPESRRGYLSLLHQACSLLGCRQRPDSNHEPAYCWNDVAQHPQLGPFLSSPQICGHGGDATWEVGADPRCVYK